MITSQARRFITPLLLSLSSLYARAQEVSLQLSPGLINYGGDLQSSAYTVKNAQFSFGAALSYRVDKLSLRAGVNFGKVQASDLNSTQYKDRNLSFASNIVDGNIALQYDFFSMNDKKFTPYIFAGVGVFHFDPYTNYNAQKIYLQPLGTEGQGLAINPGKEFYSLTQFMVPLGIGIKYKLSERFLVGFEFSNRFLFTDYLDDVSEKYPDENELFKARGQAAVDLSFRGNEIDPSLPFPSGRTRGNPNQKDNYYTTSLTVTYIFPKQSSDGSSRRKNKSFKQFDCPKRIRP